MSLRGAYCHEGDGQGLLLICEFTPQARVFEVKRSEH